MKTKNESVFFHESSEKMRTGSISSNRLFGLCVGGVFSCLALYPILLGNNFNRYLFVSGLILILFGAVYPRALCPLNRFWTNLGFYLHRLTNPIFLGIIYWGAVVPTGVLMRMQGKDSLNIKNDSRLSSYWISRVPCRFDPQSFKNQY